MPKQWGDHEYDLLFKAVGALEPFVSNFQQPVWGDHVWDLLYKLTGNIANIDGGGGSGSAQVVTAPANTTDFSMLPGGVAPTSGVYFAPRDNFTLWTIAANDNQWRAVDKNNP